MCVWGGGGGGEIKRKQKENKRVHYLHAHPSTVCQAKTVLVATCLDG